MCDNAQGSFPVNVASSAAGLLRDTFSSYGNQVAATLSQALHDGTKAESSSGVAASGSSLINQPTPRSEFVLTRGVTSENEAFRSGVRLPNASRESFEGMTVDQFLQTEHESQDDLFSKYQNLDKGKKAVYGKANGDVTHSSYETLFNSTWQPGNVDEAKGGLEFGPSNDGNEVVKLLSDPTFQPELWTEGDSEKPYIVNEEEMQISQWYIQNTQAGAPQREQLRHAVAAARTGRAYEEFESIFDAIETYQEDVWGYIRPLVEAARQERLIAEPTTTRDGPAVHRLRMIVAHLQSFGLSDSAPEVPSRGRPT
jgi:hypothetical protein